MLVAASPYTATAESSSASSRQEALPLIDLPSGDRAHGPTVTFEESILRGGRVLPGLSGEARVWDDRLSFRTSEIYGLDLIGSRRVLTSRHLDQRANWQREADFSFTAPSSENFTLSMNGGLYDARRPALFGQQRLRLGEVGAWTEHQGGDIGISLGMLRDRLRYEGGYAWSDYVRKFDSRAERQAFSNAFWGAGEVHRHRIEADLLTGGPVELSAYGLYQAGDPSFRRTPRSGVSRPFTGRDVREFGASLKLEGARFNLTDRNLQGLAGEQHRTEGEIAYGPVALSLFREVSTRGRNGASRRYEDIVGAEIEFDLDQHRYGGHDAGSFSVRQLLPSAVSFGAEHGRARLARAPDHSDSPETTLSLGLYWGWDWADTDLTLYRRVYDSRTRGAESADETEYGFDFSQGFYGESWNVFAYLSAGSFASHEIDNRWRDLWAAGGVSVSYFPERLPDVTLSVDYNRYAGALPDFDWTFRQQGLSLDLAIDLSKHLPQGASMQLHYSAVGSDTFESFFGPSSDLGHAVAMTMAVRF